MSAATVPLRLTAPRGRRPLPGFGLSLGLGMAWLGVVVLLPLLALAVRAAGLGADGWLRAIHDARVQAALKLPGKTDALDSRLRGNDEKNQNANNSNNSLHP